MERLQKYIARSGVASRRKAEELISTGHVKVNGQVVNVMGFKVSGNDVVEIDDKIIEIKDKCYLVMNKPRGIISSVSDEKGRKTVISILPNELKDMRLFPVGRLDYDTKGVLLITNDGEFMNCLVGPQSNIEKEYYVRISGIIKKEDLRKIALGVDIGGYVTQKCHTELLSIDKAHNSSLVKIIIKEGKYHQVKRMFESCGYPVKRLTRVRFGQITTEGLSEGDVRYLTPYEVKRLIYLSKNN